MSFITAIGTANPANHFSQIALADFMQRAMQLNNGEHRKLKAIFKATGIDTRFSVLEDYGRYQDFTFYANTSDFEPFPSTVQRLEVFRKHAHNLSKAAVLNLLKSVPDFDIKTVTHLIVVCCTGMYAPGLDIDLVKSLGLSTNIQRTGINFMGCYAAFNALKIADSFCKTNADAKVLIVCTELCSLHFQKEATDDNLLANALFADGSACILMEAQTNRSLKLIPENFHSDLEFDGEHDMAWTVGNLGFEMKLSTYVPEIIKKGIAKLTRALLDKISKNVADIKYFAIHPGGKKILEVVEEELGISPEQNAPAYSVLRNYGNMSSPTVLFVLNEIFQKLKSEDSGEYILSFAFGPGLTLESMVLKIETT